MAGPLGAWADAAAARYGAIGAGLLIGTAAKYGLTLSEGRPLSWRGVVADLLLLCMLGLLAITIADWLALRGDARVLTGALAAVSSDRLVRLARDRFMRRIESGADHLAGVSHAGEIIRVPAGSGVPDEVGAHSGTSDTPAARAGATLQSAFRAPTITRPPADMIEALRRLDVDP